MTDVQERIEAIRERTEAATEGPWTNEAYNAHGDPTGEGSMSVKKVEGHPNPHIAHTREGLVGECHDNARFIAASRTDIPWLLSLVEEVGRALAQMPDWAFSDWHQHLIDEHDNVDAALLLDDLRREYDEQVEEGA